MTGIKGVPQLIEPVGQARNDYDIFSDLAGHLGFQEQFTEGRDIRGWIEHAYDGCRAKARVHNVELPEFSRFWREGFIEVPSPEDDFILFGDFRADPVANPLRTPSGRIEIFSETIAGFGYDNCPGHPVWLPPKEWHSAKAAERFPLHLISNQPSTRLHSQLDDAKLSRGSKVAGREPILINSIDAASRLIENGDTVRVFNDRGACLAGAVLSSDVMEGVVQLASGAWYHPEAYAAPGSLDLHGNPNMLTRDEGTSFLGQGPAQSALVEVERFLGERQAGDFQMPQVKAGF